MKKLSTVHPPLRSLVLLSALLAQMLLGAQVRAGEAVAPSSPESVPSPAAPGASADRIPETRLEITWAENLATLDAVNADVRAVMRSLQEKSGVAIEIHEGVAGTVNLRLDKVPIEKAVDQTLAAVGQRNYLMVSEANGPRRIVIVPRGGGPSGPGDAVQRVKVRGKLRNGKEIEYYPGEIWVALGGIPASKEYFEEFIREKETKHGLSFLKSVRIGGETLLKFRVLDGQDVIKLYEQVGPFSSPNGLGPQSLEFPEEDFHVPDENWTEEERADMKMKKYKFRKTELKQQKNPFLKRGDILKDGRDHFPYWQGEIGFFISNSDPTWIREEDVFALVYDEGGILYRSWGTAGGVSYQALFPALRTLEEHTAMLERLKKNELFKRARERFTGPHPVTWGSSTAAPNDGLYAQQWHLRKIRAEQAWDIECGSKSVTVGVIDSGIDADHEDLRGQVHSRSADFTTTPYKIHGSAMDESDGEDSHGTHVSGICAARTNNNREGVAGVAGGGWNGKTGAAILSLMVDHDILDQEENAVYYSLGLAGGINLFPNVPFEEVESGPRTWSADIPWGITTTQFFRGRSSWSDSPAGQYGNNLNVALTSPTLNLNGNSGRRLRLSFWAKTDLANGDLLHVEATQDNGVNWVQLAALVGQGAGWKLHALDIPEALRTDRFKFRFRLQTDSTGTADGVYLDNIGIGYPLADVLNLSWDWKNRPDSVQQAIERAYDEGLVVVGAMDNDDRWVPAVHPEEYLAKILVVAATDEGDARWDDCPDTICFGRGSAWGPAADLSAPGADILSTVEGDYRTLSGTSMATPQVAGLAALLLSKYPNMTNAEVYQRIKSTTDPIAHPEMGTGRVNAYSALRGQRDGTPPGQPTDTMLTPGSSEIRVTWRAGDNDGVAESVLYRREVAEPGCSSPEIIGAQSYCRIALVEPAQPGSSSPYLFTDTAVVEGTAYFYRIVTLDRTGNRSIPSDELGPVQCGLAPAAPSGLQARGGNGRAAFTWAQPTENADGSGLEDLDGYRLYYDTDCRTPKSGPWVDEDSESAELDLDNDATYCVCVSALDTSGNESECSEMVSVSPIEAVWVHQTGGPNGSETSISDALASASSGDTIMVGPGTYPESELVLGGSRLAWDPRYITLRSERGPAETVIDGSGVPTMVLDVADGCRIIGFSIVNASEGIRCVFDTGVLVANNIFKGADVAITVEGCAPGGTDLNQNSVRIYNNVFDANGTGINGWMAYRTRLDIYNNVYLLGGQTGLLYEFGDPALVKMGENSFRGSGIHVEEEFGRTSSIEDGDIGCNPSFVNTDIEARDPQAYHLGAGSACVDAGTSRLAEIWRDCDGTQPDLGAFGGPYAYVDSDANGIPDCQQPRVDAVATYLFRGTAAVPIVLSGIDPLGRELTLAVETPPNHGALEGNPPAMIYTVDPDFVGTDSFLYHASAAGVPGNSAPVTITVKETDAAPSAQSQVIHIVPEEDRVSAAEIALAGTDPDGDPLRYIVDSTPTVGHLESYRSPECLFYVESGFLGAVSFTYHVSDGFLDSAPATVTIVVNNDPVIDAFYPQQDFVEIPEDGSELFSLQVSDADGEAQEISCSWSLDGSPGVGAGCSYGFNPASVPPGGGPFTLRVVATDGLGSVERSWTVVVRETVVLDNAACVLTSTWSTSTSGSGYLGTNYRSHVTGSGAGTATWTAALPVAGTYRVYARWPAASGNDTTAIYRITYAGGSDDVSVDQTQNGGAWNLLGTYAFGAAAEVRLETGNNEVAVADAVRLEWTPDPADIVLDDLGGVPEGSWTTVSGGFGGTCQTAPAGTGARTFTWTPPAVAAGTWDLYARWKSVTGGAANAKYIVLYADGRNSQVTTDQTVSGGRWVLLGSWGFAEGDAPRIVLNDIAGGTVVADAVKLVRRGAQISTIVDNDADADFDAGPGEPPDLFGWSGSWVARSGVSGFLGANYRQIGAGSGGWAQWLLPIAEAGTYELYARWTSASDRTTKARYEIEHNGQVATVVVSQQSGGGQWQYLGRFEFDGLGAESVRLQQSADAPVVADAVLFARTDEALPVIVDNTDAEYFSSGSGWNVPGTLVTGYCGSDYLQTASAGRFADWRAPLAAAGNYDISARWTAGTDRTATAQYTVFNGAGEQTTIGKSQRTNGGAWVSLGRSYQPAGEARVEIASQGDGITVADAVRFDYTVLPPPIVVDNADAAAADFLSILSGTWAAGTSLAGYYATDYLARAAGTGASVVRWTPALPLRGYYAVHAWWPTTSSIFATNAPFRIVHAEAPGGVTRTVNQQANGGKWNYLGTFLFDAGEGGFVELSDAANGRVAADAVRFSPEGR